MSADPREAILARLLQIVSGTAGVSKAARNAVDIPESIRPFAAVLDGGEEADPDFQQFNRRAGTPHPTVMRPLVVLTLGGASGAVGTAANSLRTTLIGNIINDATLQGLALAPGAIFYTGCEFATDIGRNSEAEMILSFAISYYLKPLAI